MSTILAIDLGNMEDAERLFISGIALAKTQGDRKTEGELRQAYEQ